MGGEKWQFLVKMSTASREFRREKVMRVSRKKEDFVCTNAYLTKLRYQFVDLGKNFNQIFH